MHTYSNRRAWTIRQILVPKHEIWRLWREELSVKNLLTFDSQLFTTCQMFLVMFLYKELKVLYLSRGHSEEPQKQNTYCPYFCLVGSRWVQLFTYLVCNSDTSLCATLNFFKYDLCGASLTCVDLFRWLCSLFLFGTEPEVSNRKYQTGSI